MLPSGQVKISEISPGVDGGRFIKTIGSITVIFSEYEMC
jgi:hypothetical protein